MHSCLYGSLFLWIPYALHAHGTPAEESALFHLQGQAKKVNLVSRPHHAIGSLSTFLTIKAFCCPWVGEMEWSVIMRVVKCFTFMQTFRFFPSFCHVSSRSEEIQSLACYPVILCLCPKLFLYSCCRLVYGQDSEVRKLNPQAWMLIGQVLQQPRASSGR